MHIFSSNRSAITQSLIAFALLITPFVHPVGSLGGTMVPLWSQRFGGIDWEDEIHVAIDPSLNIVMAGDFPGTVNLGGADLTSSGNTDIVVAKFNAAGVHQWSKRFGDFDSQFAYAVAADASGNIIVVGAFAGTLDLGGGGLVSAGSFDVFVAKFNSLGIFQWSQRFGDGSDQYAYSVATDAAGNVVVGGIFNGILNFGGGNLTSVGGYDVFVVKFNSAGVHQWSQRYGDANFQALASVTTDASANVLMTGRYFGTVNFGGANLTSAGGYDVFLAKLNSAGAHQWSQKYGDASSQFGGAVATDASGNVALAGSFNGTITFGGGPPLVSTGLQDVFLAKFNSAGVAQWSQRFGDASDQFPMSVAADASGNWILGGDFSGTINFGGSNLTSAGGYDVFIAKVTAAGNHVWSTGFGSADDDYALTLAAGAGGNSCIAGYFFGVMNLGGNTLANAGGYDWFMATFPAGFAEPSIQSIADVGNDQGRQVTIRFTRSAFDDAAAAEPVERYDAYRRLDPVPAGAVSAPGPVMTETTGQPMLAAAGWVFAGSAPAHGKSEYYMTAPTVADSTVAFGMYRSVFTITAATDDPNRYFESAPDSGYSVDNLAPGIPTSFAYSTGALTWDESTAEDFDYFSIYGSNTNSFASATLIDYTVSPAMDVSASPYTFYFATATDFSGNEGRPAVVNTLSGAGETPKSYVLSISSFPNPFNPATTIRYTVPSKGRVTIGIYDARGARVASLLDDEKPAGAYTVPWEGRDETGRSASSGVYFARVVFNGETRAYKMVLLK